MAYTIDDFRRDTRQLLLDPDIRQLMLDLISSAEDHLRGLEPEDILELDPETIRRLVLNAIDSHSRNVPWEWTERIRHGLQHYHPRTVAAGELLIQLYLHYRLEILEMAYTLDDFHRDTHQLLRDPEALRLLLELIPPEERLRGLDPEEVLKQYAPEDRLRGLDPEQIKAWLERTGH